MPSYPPLSKEFYTRTDVVQVAKDLLGHYLVTEIDGLRRVGKIVETEAYRGSDDKACHAYNNRRTQRTQIMFAEGGCAYVYLCYGIHHLFNIVTGIQDQAEAVLIRGLEPVEGIDIQLQSRNKSKLDYNLTAGPGSLSKAMGITTAYTGASLLNKSSCIYVEDRANSLASTDIIASPRVGVDYAEECAAWHWRFRAKGSKWTSKAK